MAVGAASSREKKSQIAQLKSRLEAAPTNYTGNFVVAEDAHRLISYCKYIRYL